MENNLKDTNDIVNAQNYRKLKSENDQLFSQNNKLIKKLEEITLEFSKSQTKLKNIELEKNSKPNVSGNFNKLLDQINLLESDNRRLCEELHNQINLDKLQSSVSRELDSSNVKQLSDIQSIKSNSREKITNLKNHIRELQKQLVKTQQIAFENECNYKECQIETLEALQLSEMEKCSFSNKISDLEEKTKNILLVHQENFELKTTLNRLNSEMQASKIQFVNLTDVLGKSEQTLRVMEQEMNSLANKLKLSEQKAEQLKTENQCLVHAMEQCTLSSDRVDNMCDKCRDNSVIIVSLEEDLRKITNEMKSYNKEKVELNDQYQEQAAIINRFEDEQNKLRTELNGLINYKSKYETMFKSKEDEIDNLNCQLSSIQQRLELRDQRVAELSNQLNKCTLDEKQMTSKMGNLSEKISLLEKELISRNDEIVKIKKEKSILSGKVEQFQSDLSRNKHTIDELNEHLRSTEFSNSELKENLDNMKSVLQTKTQEFTSKIESLNQAKEQLTYSINIYEGQNNKLEDKLKSAMDEHQRLKECAQREAESYRLDLNKTRVQADKNKEIVEQQLLDIQKKSLEIEEHISNKSHLENCIAGKNKEIELLSNKHEELIKLFSDTKAEMNTLVVKNNQFQLDLLSYQQLKLDVSDKIKENKKLKHLLSEVNLRFDMLNRNLSEEKEKCTNEESKSKEISKQLETLQFKFTYVENELTLSRNYIKELEEKQRSELKNHLDKLYSIEKDRDKMTAKLSVLENAKDSYDKEHYKYQNQIKELEAMVSSLKDEMLSRNQFIHKLELQNSALQEHIKCSQVTLVERSRDIDRLEQQVRDRSEQIEHRSSMLQEFHIDLENKLKEMQSEVETAQQNENYFKAECDKIRKSHDELLCQYNENEKRLKEIIADNKEREEEVRLSGKLDKQLELENQSLVQNVRILKDELVSKISIEKDLLHQVRRKDKELENILEKFESAASILAAKELQIKQSDEQFKKCRQTFTEKETKLKSELKSTQRKLECLEDGARKSKDKLERKLKVECDKYREKLDLEMASGQRLSEELTIISENLVQSQENLTNLKIEIQTIKSVLIDTENNCRLKAVVIDRLLKKLNMDSLKVYSDNLQDLALLENTEVNTASNETSYCEIYEEVSLQELIERISKKLECE